MKVAIEQLLKPIRVSLRSKLIICVFTLITGCSYCFLDNPWLRLALILTFFVSAEAMVWFWGNIFGRNLLDSIKLGLLSNKSIKWSDITEFKILADKMGVKLNKKCPFGIMKDLDNACSNPLYRRVIFGQVLLKKLNEKERLALVAHEFAHLKYQHWANFIFPVLAMYLVVLVLSLTASPPIVTNLTAVAASILVFVIVSWRNEYAADAGAAKYAGEESMISLLRKLRPVEKWDFETETHPSINARISKLIKM